MKNFDPQKTLDIPKMIRQFQCPGCVNGNNTDCGSFSICPVQRRCTKHVLGTNLLGTGPFALGLPKGFNRPGWDTTDSRFLNQINVRLWPSGSAPKWNHLNVAVWAMEKDGFLFVRTYAPRTNITWVDVIEGGALKLTPNAINVADFIDEID